MNDRIESDEETLAALTEAFETDTPLTTQTLSTEE